eukprot:XP_011441049.1 PREDICTED: doublesex and mab-3 related transcription factor 1 isoform X1 [Crassostrea gigas]
MSGNIIIDSELSTRRCNKCRNHGRLVTLKGHKPFCQFKNCSCKACTQLEMKKLSTALRRKEKIARDSKIDPLFDTLCQPPVGPCLVRYQPYKAMRIPCNNPSSGSMVESCMVRYQPHRAPIKGQCYSPPDTLVEPSITLSLPSLHAASNSKTSSTSYKTEMRRYSNITKSIMPTSKTTMDTSAAEPSIEVLKQNLLVSTNNVIQQVPITYWITQSTNTHHAIQQPRGSQAAGISHPCFSVSSSFHRAPACSVQSMPWLCEPTYTTLKPVSHVGLSYSADGAFWMQQEQGSQSREAGAMYRDTN